MWDIMDDMDNMDDEGDCCEPYEPDYEKLIKSCKEKIKVHEDLYDSLMEFDECFEINTYNNEGEMLSKFIGGISLNLDRLDRELKRLTSLLESSKK